MYVERQDESRHRTCTSCPPPTTTIGGGGGGGTGGGTGGGRERERERARGILVKRLRISFPVVNQEEIINLVKS